MENRNSSKEKKKQQTKKGKDLSKISSFKDLAKFVNSKRLELSPVNLYSTRATHGRSKCSALKLGRAKIDVLKELFRTDIV